MADEAPTTPFKKGRLVLAGVVLALLVGVGSFAVMVATADWDRLAKFHAEQARQPLKDSDYER